MKTLIATLMLAAATSASAAPAQHLDHLEPPFWWAGMQSPTLQLMLHGPGLAALEPRIAAAQPGVKLAKVTRLASPNYLFLDLALAPDVAPGRFQIELSREGQVLLQTAYELRPRTPGSAQRQGFGPKDAIYLVVPDRFARAEAGRQPPLPALREPVINRADANARHGGNLAGLSAQLDYIAGMGFTQIWPTPLVENDSPKYSYHGYAATDFYKIDPRFGSNEDFRALAERASGKGLGLIQDIVLNHIGEHHWWLRDLPAPDWLNQWPAYTETHHARVSLQDRHAAPSDRKRFSDGWFTHSMPDLNQRQPQLAAYLTQMSIWWVEYAGLSGLRTDTYSYSDQDFLAQWSARLLAEYPRLNIVGEEWSPYPAIVAYWQRGKKNHDGYASHAPSMMDFPLHGALLAGLKDADSHDGGLMRLYETLAHDFVYPDPDRLVLFDGNHDTPRLFSALNDDAGLTRMAWAYLAVVNRIPQFMYGTELLMRSPRERDDGAVRADFPGGFAGDAQDAASGRGLQPEQREAQQWLRRLLNWRKSARMVHEGALMHYAPEGGVYVLFRHGAAQGKPVMLVLNKNRQPVTLDTRRFAEMLKPGAVGVDVISGARHALSQTLKLPATSALVLELE